MMPGMSAPDDSTENTEPNFSDRPDRGETYGQWTSRLAAEQAQAKQDRRDQRSGDRKEARNKVAAGAVKGAVKGAAVGGVGALPGAAAGAAKGFVTSKSGRRLMAVALAMVLVLFVGVGMALTSLVGGEGTAASGGYADKTMGTVQKDVGDDARISDIRAAASRSDGNWLVLNSLHRIQAERTAHDGVGPFAIDEAYICEVEDAAEEETEPEPTASASPSASESSQGGMRATSTCADPDAKPVDDDDKDLPVVTSLWFPQGMISESAAMDLETAATFVGTYLATGENEHLLPLDNTSLDAGATDIAGPNPHRKVADTDEAKEAHQAVADAYAKIFESLPVEGAEDFADDTIAQAQSWAMGNSFAVCGAADAGGSGYSDGGDLNGSTSVNLDAEQKKYAQIIINVVGSRRMSSHAAVVAIATAAQESSLRNIAHGDRDSVGLFQQRPSQGWGTVEQIMDPAYSTNKFLDVLETVPGWEALPITVAAQRTQRSGHPDAYAKWETTARQLVKDLKPREGGYKDGHSHDDDDDHAETVSLSTTPGTTPTFALASSIDRTPTFTFADSTATELTTATVNTGGPSVDPKTTPITQKGTGEVIKRYADALASVGGWRDGGDEHTQGRASDLMIKDYKSAAGKANGKKISQFLIDNRKQLSVEYVIFDDKIWLGPDSGWEQYSGGPYGGMYAGNWNDTTKHLDHVHVTFRTTPGTDGTLVDGGDPESSGGSDCVAAGNYGSGISDAGEGDDYPFKNPAGKCAYSASCGAPDPSNPADPWGGYMRECVSFTYWRINQQMGWDGKGEAPFSNQKLGVQLGNAATWKAQLVSKGYKADNKPAPGAIAWWGANSSHPMISTGEAGHVGIVKEVLGNGDIVLEQYNFVPWRYNKMVIPANQVDSFIHVADTTDVKKATKKEAA